MKMSPTKHAERVVLANLIGQKCIEGAYIAYDCHPYAEDFPGNLIVTFEQGKDDRVHRVFFALYGKDDEFRAELRNLPKAWPASNTGTSDPILTIESHWDRRPQVRAQNVVAAFMEVARAKFTGQEAEMPEPEAWEEDDAEI